MEKNLQIFAEKELINTLRGALSADVEAQIEFQEQKREPLYKVKLKARIWILKDDIRAKLQDIVHLIKHGRVEMRFGGAPGGFDFEALYGFVANYVVMNGSWELLKLVLRKAYTQIRKRGEYLVVVSTIRQPADTLIRMRIPADLSDEEIEACLSSGEDVYKHIDQIRGYFGYFKIILTYIGNYRWEIRFQNKMRMN